MELQTELVKKLKGFCDLKSYDVNESFKPHVTVFSSENAKIFSEVWKYLKSKEPVSMRQHLVRVSILKENRVLVECDLMQREVFSHDKAVSKTLMNRSMNILMVKLGKRETGY